MHSKDTNKMRTKRINLFQFNELSEEGKKKAISSFIVNNPVPKNTLDWVVVKIFEANSYEFTVDGKLFTS